MKKIKITKYMFNSQKDDIFTDLKERKKYWFQVFWLNKLIIYEKD